MELTSRAKDWLNPILTTEQRGILISLALCNENNPKLNLAKLKVFVDFKKYRSDLVVLHENGFIKWSGYKAAKKLLSEQEINPQIVEIIDFMNNLYGRGFGAKTYKTQVLAILKQYPIEDIKLVIANRYEEWKDNPVMEKHLNPTTIFRKKNFAKYHEEATRTKVGTGILSVEKFNLLAGTEINKSNIEHFVKNDLYKIKIFKYINGVRSKNGTKGTFYGKDLSRMVNMQANIKEHTGLPEEIYILQNK